MKRNTEQKKIFNNFSLQLQGSSVVSLTVDTDMNNIYRLYIHSNQGIGNKMEKKCFIICIKKAHTK